MTAAPPLRVAIVEDDARYRDSLALLVSTVPGFTLAATFAGAGAFTPGEACAWDLVLMDIHLGDGDGIELTRALKAAGARPWVVMLTAFEDPPTILAAICAGADGYVLKRTPPAELVAQLLQITAGGAPLTAGVARTLLGIVRQAPPPARAPADPPLALSPREHEVLRQLVDGRSYKQVAAELDIGLDTVRGYIKTLYRKLQVHSVAEAVGRALREGLV